MMDDELSFQLRKNLCQWDPVDLVSITSKHEYDIECDAIASRLHPDMGVFQIAAVIKNVLMSQFEGILPVNKTEMQNSGLPKVTDGEFSKRCISVAKNIRAYV